MRLHHATDARRFIQVSGNPAITRDPQIRGHPNIKTTMRYAKVTQDGVEREAPRCFKQREGA